MRRYFDPHHQPHKVQPELCHLFHYQPARESKHIAHGLYLDTHQLTRVGIGYGNARQHLGMLAAVQRCARLDHQSQQR